MTDDLGDLRQQARTILDTLASMPFESCIPLSREFRGVTPRPGIYAFRHQQEGILYIGKSKNIRLRLRGGHKALGWAFIERLDPDSVRIGAVPLVWNLWQQALDIEALILQASRPRYNIQIRQEE
jgi:excinuclease UvrABC nuclease subunit